MSITCFFTFQYKKQKNSDASIRPDTPPVNVHDPPDTNIVTEKDLAGNNELDGTYLMVNVWNGSKENKVWVTFDDREPVMAEQTKYLAMENDIDPFTAKLQLYVFRYAAKSESGNAQAQGFELWRGTKLGPAVPQPISNYFLTQHFNHLWKVKVPDDMGYGIHIVRVHTTDRYGHKYQDVKLFEIMKQRPEPFFRGEVFQ